MARHKDESVKIKICILNKQNASINYSIRLNENNTKKESIKQINQFLNDKL